MAARTAGGAALVALPVVALSLFQTTYSSATAHVAFEAIAGFVALLASFLLLGRVMHRRLLCDVVLTIGLAIFAGANIARAFTPDIVDSMSFGAISSFLAGAACFAAAAFLPERRLNNPFRSMSAIAVGVVVAIPVTALVLDLTAPTVVALRGADIAMAGLFSVASLGFFLRAFRGSDDFLRWLASGCVLSALARVNYALPPSPAADQFTPGDILRMGFYLAMLVGAANEIAVYWRDRSRLAVLEERRRIARELHDGLAQDLFFIRATSGVMARRNQFNDIHDLVEAADRALGESRRAITVLSTDEQEPLEFALGREAEKSAKRFGLGLTLRLEPGVDATSESRLALLRIASEAIANARHGHASRVSVWLSNGTGVRLRIKDDGQGFDPAETGAGFGLQSMEERAQALGGELRIVSKKGRGTIVEAEIP